VIAAGGSQQENGENKGGRYGANGQHYGVCSSVFNIS
jgi:hypothetical protein